jgi:hypothetical protein
MDTQIDHRLIPFCGPLSFLLSCLLSVLSPFTVSVRSRQFSKNEGAIVRRQTEMSHKKTERMILHHQTSSRPADHQPNPPIGIPNRSQWKAITIQTNLHLQFEVGRCELFH